MKLALLSLCTVLFFVACAGMRVTNPEVATGAVDPKAIYIRPFDVSHAFYRDRDNPNHQVIRKSQAPIKFAKILQEELSKIAPTAILKDDEYPTTGWLVEGEFQVVSGGSVEPRFALFGSFGHGRSYMKLHVRVTEIGTRGVHARDGKRGVDLYSPIPVRGGRIIYAFDVEGGSRATGRHGSVNAAGLGRPIPFDFRNAAERIMLALSPDAFRYGYRSSPDARN